MPRLRKAASRGIATLVALVVALVASLLIGGQLAGAETAAVTANRGVVAKNDSGKMTSKVFGTASDGSKVTGTFTPLKFVKRDGKSKVKGVIDGVVTHPDGSKERFAALRTMKVKRINGESLTGLSAATNARALVTCDILNLVLGPLDLDLLGLQVHLNRVVLNIVAVSGAGNLLGNLLCAVAGLLDGGPLAGLLGQLTNLLNQILSALNLGV
jgi:hypothetical protein